MRMLLVEDDVGFARALTRVLGQSGIEVVWARDCAHGLRQAGATRVDVAIVDWMLPDSPGTWLIERLRAGGNRVPTLMLTAREGVEDRVRGLDAGADDYLTKPFHLDELLARIRALGRRPHDYLPDRPVIGRVELDEGESAARVGSERVDLTPAEAVILATLMRQAPSIVAKRLLAEELEAADLAGTSAGIETHMSRLRTKLRGGGVVIRALRERGYVIEEER